MTSSATSTDRQTSDRQAGFHAWHFFVLLGMGGATAAVMVSRETHPAALLLLSAAVVSAGFVAIALNQAIAGFFTRGGVAEPISGQARERLEREKALVLRSIKELEFDRAMGKVSDADFASISQRLRARAMALMQDLDRVAEPHARTPAEKAPAPSTCAQCGTKNDTDARFCKNCGTTIQAAGESRR